MIYTATVYYNELGKNLTNRDNVIIHIEEDHQLTEEHLTNLIHLKVPIQMIDRIVFENGNFKDVKVGELVKLTTPKTYNNGWGYSNEWQLVKVVEINDRGIKIENHKSYFDFDGQEINPRKKKDIHYIEFPTIDEIDSYNYNKANNYLINALEEAIRVGDHYNLTNDQLEAIMDIFNDEDDDFGFK